MHPVISVISATFVASTVAYYVSTGSLLTGTVGYHRNKLYYSLLVGSLSGLIELIILGVIVGPWKAIYNYLLLGLLLAVVFFFWLIRQQIGIDSKEFLRLTLERNLIDLEIAKRIEDKAAIIDRLLETRRAEIEEIRRRLM